MKTFKHRTSGQIITYKDGCIRIDRMVIHTGEEPSREYWEEVIQKEYEILSFKCIVKNAPGAILDEVRVIGESTNLLVEDYLERGSSVKNGDWAIHSVKRILDGEVFELKNKVQFGNEDTICGFITKFEI